ncbi:MAG: hypothetical protein JJE04_07475 [Acidobacteriia bacterium]|nr:hypothetical protein [Terriglobia bacterium]
MAIEPFTPTQAQLNEGIIHVCYEYANLMSAAYWDQKGAAPWRTQCDDAFLLGYRKLGDFLLNKERSSIKVSGTDREELPDILALDYLPSGFVPTWTLEAWTKEWRSAMNKQLAHVSFIRNKSWDHRKWVPRLEAEFRETWGKFLAALDTNYQQPFADEINRCRNKEGFPGITL